MDWGSWWIGFYDGIGFVVGGSGLVLLVRHGRRMRIEREQDERELGPYGGTWRA